MKLLLALAVVATVSSLMAVAGPLPTDRDLLNELSFFLNGANVAWPCASTKRVYTNTGMFVPKNVIATRVQMHKDEAFVALPRFREGIPFTLAKVCLKDKYACNPVLMPFPCLSAQEEGNCQALQSVVDLFLDPNDILWVLDTGIVNTLEEPVRRSPPKIVAYNIKTGRQLKSIDLSALVCETSRLQYLLVEYAPDGRAFAYVSDAATRAILVYDVTANKGFRVVLPRAVTLGCTNRDVLYIALAAKPCGDNVLFFTYLSGSRMFSIKTSHLRKGNAQGVVVDVGPKNGRFVILGTDGGASLFFREKGHSDIYMWNSETCFKPENFALVQSGGDCRLATQVVPGFKRLMWVMESNFNDYIQDTTGCMGASVVLHPVVKNCEY